MNSKQVLSKIAKMLNFAEDTLIQAKTADGTILQSSNFDVNDDVFEVGADGKTTPAADGEYTITFTTPEGTESTQVIDIDGGKVSEISAPDEAKQEAEGTPEEKTEETMEETPLDTNATNGGLMMAKDYVKAPKGLETETAHALPNTTDEDPRNRVGPDTDDAKDPIISLSYRISELETQLKECLSKIGELTDRKDIDKKEAQTTNIEKDIKFDDVPKLDGAPVEMSAVNLSGIHKPTSNKVGNAQNSFLSKLYN